MSDFPLQDDKSGSIPDSRTIERWRREMRLPENVARHCDAVAACALKLAEELVRRGIPVDTTVLHAAARTHDLFRFINFKTGAGPESATITAEDEAVWGTWKRRYPVATHEEACELFLRDQGFPEVAAVVRTHGSAFSPSERTTFEQHLLFYADKRVAGETIVTVAERYADIAARYAGGKQSPDNIRFEEEAHAAERLLFPDGPPF